MSIFNKLLVVCLLLTGVVAQAQTYSEEDVQALLALKAKYDTKDSYNWSAEKPVKDWYRISWNDEEPKRLTSLYISRNDMTGDIDLNSLPNLRRLRIYTPFVTSVKYDKLTKLEHLKIDMDTEAVEVANLFGLRELEIGGTSSSIRDIKLRNLPNLESIAFKYMGLNSLEMSDIGKVRQLFVERMSLDAIPLSEFAHITSIRMSYLKFDDPKFFGQFPELTEIRAVGNSFAGLDLSGNPKLTYVDITNNDLLISSLPLKQEQWTTYKYVTNGTVLSKMSVPLGGVLDYSKEAEREGQATEFLWFNGENGEPVTSVQNDGGGRFTFTETGTFFLRMKNPLFPDLGNGTGLKTQPVVVFESNPPAGFHTEDYKNLLAIRYGESTNNINWADGVDPLTWNGVVWTDETPKRVKELAGSIKNRGKIDFSVFEKLEKFSMHPYRLSEVVFENMPLLKSLNLTASMKAATFRNLPELTRLEFSAHQSTKLVLEQIPKLERLSLRSLKVSSIDLSVFPELNDVELAYGKFESIKFPSTVKIRRLQLQEGSLHKLDLSEFTNLFMLYVQGNALPFSSLATIPNRDKISYLDISEQESVLEPATILASETVDYSAEANILGQATDFTWFKSDDSPAGDAVTQAGQGVFVFHEKGEFYCQMTNGSFPGMTLRTQPITVKLGFEPSDLQTLKALKATHDSENQLNWTASVPTKDWEGVSWNDEDPKRVVGLNLNGKKLVGQLDLSAFDKLTDLRVRQNSLTRITLPDTYGMLVLDCSENKLEGSLDLSEESKLLSLECADNKLTNLVLPTTGTLTSLNCSKNQLASIDFGTTSNLVSLDVSDNKLTTIDISKLSALFYLNFENNQIENLSVSHLLILTTLKANNNKLSSLDIQALRYLNVLECSDNQLTELKLPPSGDLKRLDCSDNQLSEIRLNYHGSFEYIDCSNNQIAYMRNGSHGRYLRHFDLRGNKLDFQDLFEVKVLVDKAGIYTNQTPVITPSFLSESLGTVHLSRQKGDADYPTKFEWKEGERTMDDWNVEPTSPGFFKFHRSGEYRCVMTNEAFPDLSLTSEAITLSLRKVTVEEDVVTEDIFVGQKTSESLTGGRMSVGGKLYIKNGEETLPEGTHEINIRFEPTNKSYERWAEKRMIVVKKRESNFVWNNPIDKLGIGNSLTLDITTDSNAPISLTTSTPDLLTIDGLKITAVKGGDAQLSVKQEENEKYKASEVHSVTILIKKSAKLITAPSLSAITYGQNVGDSELTGGQADVSGSFAFVDPDMKPNAGEHKVKVLFTPEDTERYLSFEIDVPLTVHKAVPTLVWTNTFEKLGIGNSEMLEFTSDSEGSVKLTTTTPDLITIDGLIVTAVKGGEARLSFWQEANGNYESSKTHSVTVLIRQSAQLVTAPSLSDITYGQKVGDSQLTGGQANVPGSFAFVAPDMKPDAGEYDVKVLFTPEDTERYLPFEINLRLIVRKAPANLAWEGVLATMEVNASFTVTSSSDSDAEMMFSASDSEVLSVSSGRVTALKPGLAILEVRQAETDNFLGAVLSQEVKVLKRSQSVFWKQELPKLIVGESFTVSAEASSGLFLDLEVIQDENDPVVNLDGMKVTAIKTGTVTLRLVQKGDGLYERAESELRTLTVNPRTLSVPELEMALYPNPAQDMLHVKGLSGGFEYRIVNNSGLKVADGTAVRGSIDVSGLPAGIYTFLTEGGRFRSRFVKR
ncbi:hypothetical protein FUAX_09560 [Fulvitalea axinellae]|uniref:Por secretion system C-terminal sorting domain-containing protein n=1 Tax=Fulvitalea axinellae TaxID=1182444 RepID=A0AAU9D285_9BACT|nr:hypothetical protein FUAX_09560 [Fulvitalea axinellae]